MKRFGNSVVIYLVVVGFAMSAVVTRAQAPDPIVGTWKVNLTKSKYATPAPKSMSVTFAPATKGYAVTIDVVGPDGQPHKWGYTSSFDGAENPVFGNQYIDSVVAKTRAGIVEYKKAGKVVSTTASVLSEDGKMLTVTVKVFDAQGKEATNLVVYDRQ